MVQTERLKQREQVPPMTTDSAEPKTGPLRTIKRYPNRKLYDTSQSCYITLRTLSDLIRTGEEIQVVDYLSGSDITHEILLQIIRTDEKKWKLFPISSLVALIRSGGLVSNFRTELDARVQELPGVNDVRAYLEPFQTRFEEWQDRVEHQLQTLWEVPQALVTKEVEGLRERISQLEKLVQELRSKIEPGEKK
jgi:polyhydroxyalkanoate synthesis repressor PhaR